MFEPKPVDHSTTRPCFCTRCRAFRANRYENVPAVHELADKLRAARIAALGELDPRTRLDECIRICISQIGPK